MTLLVSMGPTISLMKIINPDHFLPQSLPMWLHFQDCSTNLLMLHFLMNAESLSNLCHETSVAPLSETDQSAWVSQLQWPPQSTINNNSNNKAPFLTFSSLSRVWKTFVYYETKISLRNSRNTTNSILQALTWETFRKVQGNQNTVPYCRAVRFV